MAQDLRKFVATYSRFQEEETSLNYARQLGLAYINLVNYPFVTDVLGLIPEEKAKEFGIVAFMKLGNVLRVATNNPHKDGLAEYMNSLGASKELSFEPHVCSESSLKYALSRYEILIRPKIQQVSLEKNKTLEAQISSLKDLRKKIETVSTTELFEAIVAGASSLEASDIHIEPMENMTHIRFRLDGKLINAIDIPEKSYKLLLSRIKTAAKIKLDKNNISQDGRLTVKINEEPLDIRVNALPSAYGEIVALRLLKKRKTLTLEESGLRLDIIKSIRTAISKPEGLVIFTGPTGSGKTTSLYAVLNELNHPDQKIITIEDPIEYRLDGVEQVQLDTRNGFDFPQALRAVLRQDPNIIMIGEIRDKETAEIAVNAALTGHLVLSTLHTNSAPAAFARLLQMNVPKYLLADVISLVVAQRLIRQLCSNCAGEGCEVCNETGFKGRFVIGECYQPDSATVELIKREATVGEFEDYFEKSGNITLLKDGLEKVTQQLTTEQEVRSVTG